MAVFNGIFPIQEGKEGTAARAFAARGAGCPRADFDALQARSNITHENLGDAGDADGERHGRLVRRRWRREGLPDLAVDNSEFVTWFRGQVKDVTGFDLAAPPEGPLPDVIVDWHS